MYNVKITAYHSRWRQTLATMFSSRVECLIAIPQLLSRFSILLYPGQFFTFPFPVGERRCNDEHKHGPQHPGQQWVASLAGKSQDIPLLLISCFRLFDKILDTIDGSS